MKIHRDTSGYLTAVVIISSFQNVWHNFYPARLTDLCLNAKIKPMVNQVELYPFFVQTGVLGTMKEFGVQPEAWGPMAEGKHGIFTHPVLTEIGAKYGKTAVQAALCWNVQRGVVINPRKRSVLRKI